MQVNKILAQRYAAAFAHVYGAEISPAQIDRIAEYAHQLEQMHDLSFWLSVPGVATHVKIESIEKTLRDYDVLILMPLIRVLVSQKRLYAFAAIVQQLVQELYVQYGIALVHVYTAHEISAEEKKLIENIITCRGIAQHVTRYTVKPSLIGGFVITCNDTIIEYSIAHQCARARQEIAAHLLEAQR